MGQAAGADVANGEAECVREEFMGNLTAEERMLLTYAILHLSAHLSVHSEKCRVICAKLGLNDEAQTVGELLEKALRGLPPKSKAPA